MKNYTSVYAGEDVKRISRTVYCTIDATVENLRGYKSSIIIGNKLQTLGWTDAFRLLVEGLDSCPLAYRNLILNSAGGIYKTYPLAVSLYLLTLQALLKKKSLNCDELRNDINERVENRKRTSSRSVKLAWRQTIQDQLTLENFETLCSALELAGTLGTIEIKAGKYTEIETFDGISISAFLHPSFSSRISEYIHLQDLKIAIIDGAILDISELNKLLVYANESKTPLAIFASQFSEDILNTLVINWRNGKLKVLPMVFGSELEDLNQPGDLSMATKSSIISKDIGNSLSLIDEEELAIIKSITVDSNARKCDIILDEKMLAHVFSLRLKIQQKRDEERLDDVKKILNIRLGRLTGRKTILTIPCELEELGLVKDRSSSLFAFIKCCANEGVVETQEIYKKLGLTNIEFLPVFLPAFSVRLSILKAIADFEQMNKIGALILTSDYQQ